MDSQSLSSSSASTVPSAQGNSDYDEQQSTSDRDSYVSYEEERFESDCDHEHEPTVAVSVRLKSSSSAEYRSDEFEDDQEVTTTIATLEVVVLEDSGERSSIEDDEYANESFERDEGPKDEQVAATTEANGQDGQQRKTDDEPMDKPAEDKEFVPTSQKDFDPRLGTWCSTKIGELRVASMKPRVRKANRAPDKIPAAVVENLIRRATRALQCYRPQQQHGISRPRSRQKLSIPASLTQRAQTQLWLAKSFGDNTNATHHPHTTIPETPLKSTQSVAPTFCSVKREKLLGQLASIQFPETAKRWAAPESGGFSLDALEFVQNLTAKQREVSAAKGATNGPGGRMLHRVAMATQLQLEDSIALRHQADTLLGRRS